MHKFFDVRAALQVLFAEIDGGVFNAEWSATFELLTSVFKMPFREADEIFLFAKWLTDRSSGADDTLKIVEWLQQLNA